MKFLSTSQMSPLFAFDALTSTSMNNVTSNFKLEYERNDVMWRDVWNLLL